MAEQDVDDMLQNQGVDPQDIRDADTAGLADGQNDDDTSDAEQENE